MKKPGLSLSIDRWLNRDARPLQVAFDTKHNSLTLARFIFAAMVVVSHSFPLGGFHNNSDPWFAWSNRQTDLGALAVDAFFLISGFLVAKSYDSVKSPVSSSSAVASEYSRLTGSPWWWAHSSSALLRGTTNEVPSAATSPPP